MAETGVKIGAIQNPEALLGRVFLSKLRPLSKEAARELSYQTKWPAIIPASPRLATLEEIVAITTPQADSGTDMMFFKVNPDAMAELEALRRDEAFPDTKPPLGKDGPLIELAPGIEAHLSIIRQDPDRPTTALFNHKTFLPAIGDPDRPDGASIALHLDEKKRPIGTHKDTGEDRSLIVVMNAPEGPSTHDSLFVPTHTVFDIARHIAPGDKSFVPTNENILPWLAEHHREAEVATVRLTTGMAAILPSGDIIHDGGPNRQRRTFTGVFREPKDSWNPEVLKANSAF